MRDPTVDVAKEDQSFFCAKDTTRTRNPTPDGIRFVSPLTTPTASPAIHLLPSLLGGIPKSLFMAATTTRTPLPRPPDTPPDLSPLHSRRYARSPALLSLSCSIKPFPKLEISIGRRSASCFVARSGTAMGERTLSDERMLVMVPPHPLIKHWISVLRNEQTPCAIFKSAMAELGRLLIYEASRDWLPTITGEIQSPIGPATVEFIDPREPVVVIPILRAGLVLAEHAPLVLPATKTYHLGMRRDEETLQPSVYLNNLPDKFPEGSRVLVVDPMLATGGTIVAAIELLKDRGVDSKQIKVISAVASPPALQKLSKKFSGLRVYAGIIDPVVNEKGFIVPGLGDAGDRSFGT